MEDPPIPAALASPVIANRASSPHAAARGRVAMLVPGGLEHAGGIGRWAGYLDASWTEQALQPALEIIDTRGTGHAGRAA